MTGEELGKKLLQSVKEMKEGKIARIYQVKPNKVAAARTKTGLTQAQFAKALHIFTSHTTGMGARKKKPIRSRNFIDSNSLSSSGSDY